MPEENPVSWKVVYPELVRRELLELCHQAAETGALPPVLDAIRYIDTQLRNRPQSFGEIKYRYRALELEL